MSIKYITDNTESALSSQTIVGDLNVTGTLSATTFLGGWQEVIVDVSASQLQNMFGNPILLLPAPPTNKYYTYYGFLEYTPGNTPYGGSGKLMIGDIFEYVGYIFNNWWLNNSNTGKRKIEFNSADLAGTNTSPLKDATFIDKAVYFALFSGSNFTSGNGTIKIKLYYKLLNWG